MRGFLVAASVAAAALSFVSATEGDAVPQLDPTTFPTVVGKDKGVFVKFYAPWCGHCKSLAPDWATLAETFPGHVVKVDADKDRDLGTEYGVSGFPTLKYFPAGSMTPEDYNGGRTLDELVAFMNGKLGTSKKVKKAPSAVIDIDDANIDAVLGDSTKAKLFEAYAPWCGHCKNLAPVYEKLGAVFDGDAAVSITRVDADKYKDIGQRFKVQGFPTLFWIPAGKTGKPEDIAEPYEGGRTLEDFVEFINKEAGTERDASGGLLPTAGRLAAFDEIAKKFVAATSDAQRKVKIAEAKALVAKLTGAELAKAESYIKIMGKVLEKGADYLSKESARLAGMLTSESITKAKKADLLLRKNVLAAFA